MHSVTQDMRYRQSLLEYAQKYGVSRAAAVVDHHQPGLVADVDQLLRDELEIGPRSEGLMSMPLT